MAEEDKLFNFLAGLQPWAQTELRRVRVRDLPSALAAAEELVDFKAGSSEPDRGDAGRAKDKGKAWKKANSSDPPVDGANMSRFGGGGKKRGCFICEGDHRMADCPKRKALGGEKLNAVVAESDEDEARLGAVQLVTGLRLLDDGPDETGVGRGAPTYANVVAGAATGNGRGVPGKLAGEGRVDAKGVKAKGVLGSTTRASSSSSGAGLLHP